MLIEVEATPNPASLRFLMPRPLPTGAPLAFDKGSDPRPKMADRLLLISGITDVLIARDFVAVSRDSSAAPWRMLRTDVIVALVEALAEGEDAELGNWRETRVASDPVEAQITDILRTRIAPAVARDGGDITLVSYSEGVAIVEMRGACGGCPSALMTLKRGVETTLKRYVPELERVEAVRDANPQKPFWKTMLIARGARFREG